MMGVSKGAVWTAGLVLLAAASVGSYLGYSRAVAAPGGDADSDAYTATTPLDAKKATSVDAATPPPVDEAYIRKIAHDEAETILHPPKKVAVASSDDSDDSDDSDTKSSPGSNPPTPPPIAIPPPTPAADVKPPPPPPTGLY